LGAININQRAYTGHSKFSKLKWSKMNLFKAGVDVLKLAIDGLLYRLDKQLQVKWMGD
jgi:hypothetical protein